MISIFIASLGLYGLILFAVNSRTKEIGIRKVLGATWSSISLLLGGYFMKLAVLGFLLACVPAYYFANQWLSGFAYRVEIGAEHFLTGLLLIIIAVLITTVGKLKGATKLNPAEALKGE